VLQFYSLHFLPFDPLFVTQDVRGRFLLAGSRTIIIRDGTLVSTNVIGFWLESDRPCDECEGLDEGRKTEGTVIVVVRADEKQVIVEGVAEKEDQSVDVSGYGDGLGAAGSASGLEYDFVVGKISPEAEEADLEEVDSEEC